METVHEFCRRILESGDLSAKLAPPQGEQRSRLEDRPAPALFIDRPARSGSLRLTSGAERLPRFRELGDRHARAVCLEKFCNHELMAVELFAWALLAFPEAPAGLRRGLVQVLQEEQEHVRLYLDRLERVGSGLGQSPLGDYFWQQVPAIRESSNGPLAFLCTMGLTLEQANLDFSLLYRDAFQRHEDEESAALLQRIHDDEIGHVRLASHWLRKLSNPGSSDLDTYLEHVPFPLSAARAKGRTFHAKPREQAGLSPKMIAFVRDARPYERSRPDGVSVQRRGRCLLYPNIGAEEGHIPRRGRREIEKMASLWAALFDPFDSDDSRGHAGGTAAGTEASFASRFAAHGGLVPWWSDDPAAHAATEQGEAFGAVTSAVSQRVHDKAFSIEVAHDLDEISQYAEVLSADECLAPDASRSIEARVSKWPKAWQRDFVLKPRLGTTGRGWVRGKEGRLTDPDGLQRLGQRQGAILEPWAQRVEDYSAQLWIDPDGTVQVLGLTVQKLSPRGMYVGNAGVFREGRFTLGAVTLPSSDAESAGANGDSAVSTSRVETHAAKWREESIAAAIERGAMLVGKAAAEAGFHGAAGIDAFTYIANGQLCLRPVVELNARFTGGWVVLGWVERLLREFDLREPRDGNSAIDWRFWWKASGWSGDSGMTRAAGPRSSEDLYCIHRISPSTLSSFSPGALPSEPGSGVKTSPPSPFAEKNAPEIWLRYSRS